MSPPAITAETKEKSSCSPEPSPSSHLSISSSSEEDTNCHTEKVSLSHGLLQMIWDWLVDYGCCLLLKVMSEDSEPTKILTPTHLVLGKVYMKQ